MGMFSWNCKGCGHELIQGEVVRLNGQTQEYDGYGGSAAANNNYDPSAWHNRCFKKASRTHQLDESKSKPARNQGFGPAKLEFKAGYDEAIPASEFTVIVYAVHHTDDNSRQFDFYYTNNGRLEDQREYQQRYDTVGEGVEFDYEAWSKMSEDERGVAYKEHQAKIEAAMGSAMPRTNAKTFASLQEAIDAVDAILPALPVELGGEYDLTISASQVVGFNGRKIEGAVYQRSVNRKYDRTGENWVKLDELEVQESYRLGTDKDGLAEEQLEMAIALFNEAHQALKEASEALGRAAQPFVLTDDVEKLHELVDRLPKQWSGVRRVYEKLIVLEPDKEPNSLGVSDEA